MFNRFLPLGQLTIAVLSTVLSTLVTDAGCLHALAACAAGGN